ncbi:glutamate racemase [soil metagenome]
MSAPRIGVFDSGVGGLSVLRALAEQMPLADLHYVADSSHAPYGERSDQYVVARSLLVARHLIEAGAQTLVIACNTATAVAASLLRESWPGVPIVGIEPGIKPALAQSRNGRIGVMATEGTLRSAKFRRLLEAHAGMRHVQLQACPGLAAAIESGDLRGAVVAELVERYGTPLRAAGIDTLVLGCTHYPFVREQIQRTMGEGVAIIDTASAVARQAAVVSTQFAGAPDDAISTRSVELQTTGDPEPLGRIAEHWLGFVGTVTVVPGTGVEPVRPLSRSGGF